ncbi:MAG: cell division protein SepF [Lachnospiraceae bacterium]|nr:cell division protein SepF [Lachnospiraceae bacterium]
MAAFSNLVAAVNSRFGRNDDYYDDYLDDEEYVEEKPVKKSKPAKQSFGKISPFTGSRKAEEAEASHEVVSLAPTAFENAQAITEKLLDGCTVILNTESCDDALAKRILDYTCGTVYALNCSLVRISFSSSNSPKGVYAITPEDTNISGDFQEDFMS